jgi:hypothetical protein
MEKEQKYRPANIEFDVAVDGTPVPEKIGTFETSDEARPIYLTYNDAEKFLLEMVVGQWISLSDEMRPLAYRKLRELDFWKMDMAFTLSEDEKSIMKTDLNFDYNCRGVLKSKFGRHDRIG